MGPWDCVVNCFSSRMCEHGTKGCTVRHTALAEQKAEQAEGPIRTTKPPTKAQPLPLLQSAYVSLLELILEVEQHNADYHHRTKERIIRNGSEIAKSIGKFLDENVD